MSIKEKKIEIIRKLMATANDPAATQNERDTANAMAAKLMAEYQILLSELNDSESGYLARQIHEFGRYTMEIDLGCRIINMFCYVKCIKTENPKPGQKRWFALEIFGEAGNVEAARDMFLSLLNAFDHLWVQYQIKTRSPASERRAFVEGVAGGFILKMQNAVEEMLQESGNSEKTGLALIGQKQKMMQKLEEYNESKGIKLSNLKTTIRNTSGSDRVRMDGFEQGKNLNLNKKVGGSNQKSLG